RRPRSWGCPPAAPTGTGSTPGPGCAAKWASAPSPDPRLPEFSRNPGAACAFSRIEEGGQRRPPRCVMNEEEIFHQALALSCPEERAAYLERACAGDPALRASVEALLRANVGATGFLDEPARTPLLAATVDGRIVAERSGALIGPYKLLEPIGEGGFGVVFMA